MVGQRSDVALHGLELLAHVLGPFDAFHHRRQEGDDPADRDQALPDLRDQIPLAADRDQDLGISLGLAVARAFRLEDVVGNLIDFGAGALQNVGAAVDHRVQQFHQHHFARDPRHAGAGQLVLDEGKRLWLVVAHRDQAVTGQDEGDGRRFRHIGVGLAHQRRGHVTGAVLDIEPAGNLDLLHVFPGRHRDPGQPLNRAVLLHRGVQQVDPDRIVRQQCRLGGQQLLQGGFGGNKHRKHGQLRKQGSKSLVSTRTGTHFA